MSRRPVFGSLWLSCGLLLAATSVLADSAISVDDGQCPDKVPAQVESASPAKQSAKSDTTATTSSVVAEAGKSGKPRPRWQSFLPGMIR